MGMVISKNLKTDTIREALTNLIAFFEKQQASSSRHQNKKAAVNGNMPSDKEQETTIGKAIKNEGSPAQAKRLKTMPKDAGEEGALFVKSSGVVLLHFFLAPYFEDLKLLADGKFVSEKAHQRAVLLLHYLATGETEAAEFELALQKILCGYPMEDTLPASVRLTKREKAESDKLLNAVIDYWTPMKNTSIAGLRGTFLQRDGKLTPKENGWLLTVEQKTVDILLGKLPWGFSTIRLSWMDEVLNVDWY
jgi:hypothetical protein